MRKIDKNKNRKNGNFSLLGVLITARKTRIRLGYTSRLRDSIGFSPISAEFGRAKLGREYGKSI